MSRSKCSFKTAHIRSPVVPSLIQHPTPQTRLIGNSRDPFYTSPRAIVPLHSAAKCRRRQESIANTTSYQLVDKVYYCPTYPISYLRIAYLAQINTFLRLSFRIPAIVRRVTDYPPAGLTSKMNSAQ